MKGSPVRVRASALAHLQGFRLPWQRPSAGTSTKRVRLPTVSWVVKCHLLAKLWLNLQVFSTFEPPLSARWFARECPRADARAHASLGNGFSRRGQPPRCGGVPKLVQEVLVGEFRRT